MRETMTAAELVQLLGTAREPFLLDVREPEEVSSWAIPGAHNVALGELSQRLTELPPERLIVTVCASGSRSLQAANVLHASGFEVANLLGGMGAWGLVYDTANLKLPDADLIQIRRRGKGCLSYLVGAGNEAFAIDPSADLDIYVEQAEDRGWQISRVFDTHLHADHLSGARALAALTGASLHLNAADPFVFPFQELAGGEVFVLPGGAELSVLHTPGHTEGSTVFRVDDAVMSGDTIFVDGVGRPDLAESAQSFAHNLYASLTRQLLILPEDTLVLPAHYGDRVAVTPGAVVGARLRALLDELKPLGLNENEFVSWVTSQVTERPPNYRAIVQVNCGQSPLTEEVRALEVGPNRCAA